MYRGMRHTGKGRGRYRDGWKDKKTVRIIDRERKKKNLWYMDRTIDRHTINYRTLTEGRTGRQGRTDSQKYIETGKKIK